MTPYPKGTIILYDNADPFGAAIRVFSGEGWTHVAMSLGDGTAIQCIAGQGVSLMPERQQEKMQAVLYPGDIDFVLGVLKSRLGEPYDYCGLVANPLWNLFHYRYPDPKGKWNCATFLAEPMGRDHALGAIYRARLFRGGKPLAAVVPQDFASLA